MRPCLSGVTSTALAAMASTSPQASGWFRAEREQALLGLGPGALGKEREGRRFPLEQHEAVALGLPAKRRGQADPPLLVQLVLVSAQKTRHTWHSVGKYGEKW